MNAAAVVVRRGVATLRPLRLVFVIILAVAAVVIILGSITLVEIDLFRLTLLKRTPTHFSYSALSEARMVCTMMRGVRPHSTTSRKASNSEAAARTSTTGPSGGRSMTT